MDFTKLRNRDDALGMCIAQVIILRAEMKVLSHSVLELMGDASDPAFVDRFSHAKAASVAAESAELIRKFGLDDPAFEEWLREQISGLL